MSITVVCNSRAEEGPLESVLAALPEAVVARYDAAGLSPVIAMAQALPYFTAVYTHQKPKLVIVLGDRYETLAAALAAFFMRIPIAHIHGGETTTGAFDDALRHSITHMATLHFAPTLMSLDRIKWLRGWYHHTMVENLHLVGAPGLDGIEPNSAKRDHALALVTFHPETMAADYGVGMCRAMLDAIGKCLLGYEIVFCGVNADPGGAEIRQVIENHIKFHGGRYMPNASHQEYIALMQHAQLVIGNSSAGIIEAPWVGVPTVNIGARQNGRPMAESVFSISGRANSENIADLIRYALEFKCHPKPQYSGGAAPKIASIVRKFVGSQP